MTRVAALLPAATDIVIALGSGDALVAVTHACTLPTGLTGVPRVTRSRVTASDAARVDARVSDLSGAEAPLFAVDESLLAAQRPDVILTQAVCDVCAVREEDARALAARMRPSPALTTLGASTVEGVFQDILSVAASLDIPEEGEELVAGLRSRIGRIHATLKANRAPRPRVVVVEWTDPPFGAGHWVPDMVRRAGGHEPIGNAGEVSRRVSVEQIQAAKPEAILVAPCGYRLREAIRETEELLDAEAWSWAREKPVWALDANRLTSSPGPGVVHGIEVIARVLHPTLFGNPSARDAVQIQL